MLQDLEDALGEVEFKDGIPDVKFSKVRMMSLEAFLMTMMSFAFSEWP